MADDIAQSSPLRDGKLRSIQGSMFEQVTRSRGAILCASGLVLLWAAVVGLGVGGHHTAHLVSDLGQCAAGCAAGALCLRSARREPERRLFWLLCGFAALSWGMGQGVWTIEDETLAHGAPTPSLADVGFLASSLLFICALASIVRSEAGLVARARSLGDGFLIAGSLLLTSWLLVLSTVFHGTSSSLATQIVSLAYPSFDVVVLTLLFYTQARARRTAKVDGVPFGLLSAGLGAIALSDSAFAWATAKGSYSTGSVWLNAGWVVGFTLIGLATLTRGGSHATRQAETELEHAATMLAPYGALAVALTVSVLCYVRDGDRSPLVFALQAALSAAVMGRQAVTLLENRAIARTLEDRVAARTREVAASARRFRALVLHSSDVTTVVDPSGFVLYQSDSVRAVFGYQSEELVGSRIESIVDEAHAGRLLETMARAIDTPQQSLEVWVKLRRRDGALRDVTITITSLLDDPDVRALVLNTRDITDELALGEQLRHQAFHDPLTSLANRALFRNRLDHALASDGASTQILYLDLDRFKEVNDTLGHGRGDALLVQVATRVASCVRPQDTIARLGGDEFAILRTSGNELDAEALALEILARFEEPFPSADDAFLSVRPSIGIATAEDGETGETLLRNADLAMYSAKAAQTGFAVYDPSMHRELLERLQLVRELPEAIRRGELRLDYQPTVSIADSTLIGVEALVRWDHPRLGPLSPGAFVPLAEQNGLIVELGRWVLSEACRQAVVWSQVYGASLTMNVNVTAEELRHPDFASGVLETVRVSGLSPGQLVLELTESSLVAEFERCVSALDALRQAGVRIAIDDFGTGYSSLTYIHRLPIDILKIDRSFITRIDADGGRNKQIVQAIMTLAKELGIVTIGEGVEHAGELSVLRALTCDIAQGYLTGRPAPPASIAELLAGEQHLAA